MDVKEIILEAEWVAEDIKDYCNQNGIRCTVLTHNDIFMLNKSDFLSQPFFCSTDVVQHHLQDTAYVVPDTYETSFMPLLKRHIDKCKFSDLISRDMNRVRGMPFFVKPIGNNKAFDGIIIKSTDDINHYQDFFKIDPLTDVYVSDVVTFTSEYRLFIGNGKIYARGHQRGLSGPDLSFDSDFEQELLAICKRDFYAIDIGLQGTEWSIVEINPPFSLDDYDINIDTYVRYGIDFWTALSEASKASKASSTAVMHADGKIETLTFLDETSPRPGQSPISMESFFGFGTRGRTS